MKRMMQKLVMVWAVVSSFMAAGQVKVNEQRMEQDVEVAENILSTLARQQFGKRNFFPIEVSGHYLPGYGVTLRLPQGGAFNFLMRSSDAPNIMENVGPGSYSYSYSISTPQAEQAEEERARAQDRQSKDRAVVAGKAGTVRSKSGSRMKVSSDSLDSSMEQKFMEIAKSFLADYGDVISQLRPEEKIIITNQSEEFAEFEFRWPGGMGARRSMMSAEAKRDDITQLKQGKITRDQFLSRLTIVNTETSDKLDPDLEVLSSMFTRLYRADLSKTYYTEGEVSYERLKDYGVIYFMRVYSSDQEGDERWSMPTLAMNNVSTPERNKKVKELYPKFESELKDNLIEYGRTLRSLKDDEQVVLNVKLTKCVGCGIPASIEVSVKNSVLKDYGAGKTTKEAAVLKVIVKKVGIQ